jgi:hypothetical protein
MDRVGGDAMKWCSAKKHHWTLRLPLGGGRTISMFVGDFFWRPTAWTVHAFGGSLRVYQLGRVCIIVERRVR